MESQSNSAAVAVEVCPTPSGVAGSSVQSCDSGGACTAIAIRHPGIVYCLTSPSGKSYVGQTTNNLERRFSKHCTRQVGRRGAINRAIQKYGALAFSKSILFHNVPDLFLDTFERIAIATIGTLAPRGYNLTSGGEAGKRMSEQTRKLLSAIKLATTDETRALISETLRRRWVEPEFRKQFTDRLNRSDYRKLRSSLAKLRWENPEERERMIGFIRASSTKRSATLKATWATPESRARKSAASKRVLQDPAVKAKRIAQLDAARALSHIKRRKTKGGEDVRIETMAG